MNEEYINAYNPVFEAIARLWLNRKESHDKRRA